MKKYFMLGLVALTFASCGNDMLESFQVPEGYQQDAAVSQYESAFKATFGTPDFNQTWGFGLPESAIARRSMATPEVLTIAAPWTEADVATYLETAQEPNSENVADNFDNTGYAQADDLYSQEGYWAAPEADRNKFHDTWPWDAEFIAWVKANHPTWIKETPDETFVRNFKITGTYSGTITVAATEGLTDGVENGNQRTIVVTGTWNITDDQTIGSLGRIIIARGGIVNVANGKKLDMVNQAQLVVLEGGKLTGAGAVEVNNGNAVGKENYNKGTVDVASFNNNFGKFYNYGDFKVNEYIGGAQESNLYNHHLVSVDHFSGTPNARIFNGCQCYIKNDARIRNYEGVQGSALIVGGQLMLSGSEDGTTTPTYVALEAGALVQAGSLYNNGTSWVGPTENGYAVLSIGQFDFMNWEQDAPQNGGYFANNLYVQADNWTNVPDGNGMQQKTDNGTEYYTMSKADWKFQNVVANATGNGNVTIVEKGDDEVIPADPAYVQGQDGCTPGFKIKQESSLPKLHVMAEDLSATSSSDFDFNDVVFDVFYVDENTVTIKLLAAGGTLPLRIAEKDEWEVHKLFDVDEQCMVNTGTKYHTAHAPYSQATKPYVTLTLTGKTWSSDQDKFAKQVRDQLKLEVQKGENWYELKAEQGQPACKIATAVNIYMKDADWYPNEYRWPYEKQNIGDLFRQYVANPSAQWYTTK